MSEDLAQAMEKALAQVDVVATSWVVVVECIGKDGTVHLLHEVSPDLPNWTRTGMLYAAIDMAGLIYEDEA